MDDRSNSRSIIRMSCLSFIKVGMLWPVSGGPKSATATMNVAKEPAKECLAWKAEGTRYADLALEPSRPGEDRPRVDQERYHQDGAEDDRSHP